MSRTRRRDLRCYVGPGPGPAGLSVAGYLGCKRNDSRSPCAIRESGIGMLANPAHCFRLSGFRLFTPSSSRQLHGGRSHMRKTRTRKPRRFMGERRHGTGNITDNFLQLSTAIYVPWHSTILDTSIAYTILVVRNLARHITLSDHSLIRSSKEMLFF